MDLRLRRTARPARRRPADNPSYETPPRSVPLVRPEAYQELLLDTVASYYRLSGAEQRTEERLVRSGRYGQVDKMAQTVLERMKAKARREGEVLAAQRAVQQAIRVRFPAAAPSLLDRVEQIGAVPALENLLARVIEAGNMEEVEQILQAGS